MESKVRRPQANAAKCDLVYFVGGYTLAEVAALRTVQVRSRMDDVCGMDRWLDRISTGNKQHFRSRFWRATFLKSSGNFKITSLPQATTGRSLLIAGTDNVTGKSVIRAFM